MFASGKLASAAPIAIGTAKEPSACKGFVNHIQVMKEIKYAIETYNTLRPHCSCEKLTPQQAHEFGSYKHKKRGAKKRYETEKLIEQN